MTIVLSIKTALKVLKLADTPNKTVKDIAWNLILIPILWSVLEYFPSNNNIPLLIILSIVPPIIIEISSIFHIKSRLKITTLRASSVWVLLHIFLFIYMIPVTIILMMIFFMFAPME